MSNKPEKRESGVLGIPFMFIWSIFKSTKRVHPKHLLECLVVQNTMLFLVAALEFVQDDLEFTLEVIALLLLLGGSIVISWVLLGQPLTAKDWEKRCKAYEQSYRSYMQRMRQSPQPTPAPQPTPSPQPTPTPAPQPTPVPPIPPAPPIPPQPTPAPSKQTISFGDDDDREGEEESMPMDELSFIKEAFNKPTPKTKHSVKKVSGPQEEPTPLTPPTTTVVLDDDSEDIPMVVDEPTQTVQADGFLESSSENDIGFESVSRVSDYMQNDVGDVSQFNNEIETQAIGGTVTESLITNTVAPNVDEMEEI